MRTLTVSLLNRSYEIHIGSGLLGNPDLITSVLPGDRVAIVSNTTVAPLYIEPVVVALARSGVCATRIVLPDGEKYKSFETLNLIYDELLSAKCDRTTTVLALGGGVVGDLAGFAAATYQRGIAFIQLPTTLLAQVDSSVGGKTGINHPRGKNMIGAFWQPKRVVIDLDTLKTLPPRELSAGLAEVVKYGLIYDVAFLDWIETNLPALLARDTSALEYAIERSCAIKAAVVAADEHETAKENGRALLNLGHTFGHAIETGAGYGRWLHGEAVAAGMVMAAELSSRLGWIDSAAVARVRRIIEQAGLPVRGLPMGSDRYLELMGHDKKVIAGRLRLVLLKRIGEATTFAEAPESEIRAAIEACSS